MKTMDRLYERLKPSERFKIAVSAFGRGDLTEVDRLNDSTGYRVVKVQEPAYFCKPACNSDQVNGVNGVQN